MSDIATPAANAETVINFEPHCGICFHWSKHPTELRQGVCMALPPGCAFKGNALVKTRPNLAYDERGCTALFAPRPEVLAEFQRAGKLADSASPDLPAAGAGTILAP